MRRECLRAGAGLSCSERAEVELVGRKGGGSEDFFISSVCVAADTIVGRDWILFCFSNLVGLKLFGHDIVPVGHEVVAATKVAQFSLTFVIFFGKSFVISGFFFKFFLECFELCYAFKCGISKTSVRIGAIENVLELL